MYLTTSRRVSDEDIDNKASYRYWAELALFGDSRMYIGNYVCKSSVDDHDRKSSNFTLFWEGGPFDQVFVLSGKNIIIYIEPDDSVIFPCHVNDPFANVTLKREDQILSKTQNLSDTWVPVGSNNNNKWEYRPEIGFIYRGNGKLPVEDYPPSGNYKCVLENVEDQGQGSEDVVYMSFYLGVEKDIKLDKPIITNATLRLNQREMRYECCSSSAKPPRIHVHSCCDPATCKELIPAMKTQQSSFSSASQMTSAVNKFFAPQSTNMFSSHKGSCSYTHAWPSQAEVEIVQCIGDGITAVEKFLPRIDQWDNASLQKWVNLVPMMWRNPTYQVKEESNKTDSYLVYSGTSVVFTCQTTYYFFSYGIRFSTHNSDGKRTLLPDNFETEQRKKYPTFEFILLLHNPPLAAEINITITPDIKSLTCHVPITNSSAWMEKTVHLRVKSGEKPGIITDAQLSETIVWTLNATQKSLICKTTGDPEPRVIWTKDDKPITSNFNATRHTDGSYILYIPKVTHDIQGKYSCIAMNFKGQAVKTFTVFAEEMETTHAAVIIIITILILIILLGVGVLVRRTMLQRKSLDNLREHVYPREEGIEPQNGIEG
ncbi:Telokin [Folsomia candida]|uniref:Telokin n=1 Tax=Folsomia candida TaxID=158441 RepID=A0A226E273_FOLCA|nr:Telokin [Folsomia candida]